MHDLLDVLIRHAEKAPGDVAWSDARQSLTRADFARRVVAATSGLATLPQVLGLFAESGVDWAVLQLAAAFAGKTLVPLPTFFSAAQLGHVAHDAGVETIIADAACLRAASDTGLQTVPVAAVRVDSCAPAYTPGFQQIIYTSGSSGTPKGVVHGGEQILWSTRALADAIEATPADRHLSVLPLPLLLETLCGIFVPAWVGARVHFATAISEGLGRADARGIAAAFDEAQPTTSVVVPQWIDAWTDELAQSGREVPKTLRFVAVGGAKLPQRLTLAATRAGIPLFEGYGLSECCSVVALNRPGAARDGTVGRPLPGLDVTIDGGEIVVTGPTVMSGYLRRPAHVGSWRTGDLGSFDADGFLTVHGRKDNLIVTPAGRNVSPEWVESAILDDRSLAAAAVATAADGGLTALAITGTVKAIAPVAADVATQCLDLPAYARPRSCLVMDLGEAARLGLLTPNGRIHRGLASLTLDVCRSRAVPLRYPDEDHR